LQILLRAIFIAKEVAPNHLADMVRMLAERLPPARFGVSPGSKDAVPPYFEGEN